jgi:cytoskeletal protein RodZ
MKKLVLIGLIIVIVALIWAARANAPSGHDNTVPATSQSAPTTPDRVKASSGPNGDTSPSSTGTGPGSDNSLLSR